MNINLQLDSLTVEDLLAAQHAIFVENRLREQNNAQPGAIIVPLLPASTEPEVITSYASILSVQTANRHSSFILESQSENAVKERFTKDEFMQIVAGLTSRLNKGESKESVVESTQKTPELKPEEAVLKPEEAAPSLLTKVVNFFKG